VKTTVVVVTATMTGIHRGTAIALPAVPATKANPPEIGSAK
jgi:hypothetical protein